MTPLEFAAKVESEGFWYAFEDYGLSSSDIDPDSDLELIDMVEEFETEFNLIRLIAYRLQDRIQELLDE